MRPAVIKVNGIGDLEREVFGPILHVATFKATDLPQIIQEINATGYGLTFGLHSRIDNRVQDLTDALSVGNIYVNRNQIGAVVGSQPFGGEGLSGTGPKAGGPHYLRRFTQSPATPAETALNTEDEAVVQTRLTAARDAAVTRSTEEMPGPTGESNRLSHVTRPPVLCLGPGEAAAQEQARAVTALGGVAVTAPGTLPDGALTRLHGFSGAVFWGPEDDARKLAQDLARRKGPILPLITGYPDPAHVLLERHVCIDTTAAGGNAALLAEAGSA